MQPIYCGFEISDFEFNNPQSTTRNQKSSSILPGLQ
jgi:hypothetical protein